MLKRKPSRELSDRPHDRGSIFAGDPTRRQRKRLFRNRDQNNPLLAPEKEREMTALLEFILKNEEAFQNHQRLSSLYADFRQQYELNREGYHANVAAWIKALSDASRAGLIPAQGATNNLLSIRTSNEFVQALSHPQYGKPTCMPSVFHDAVQKKEVMPLNDFIHSTESIYKVSWLPSAWKVLQWSLRQMGVLGPDGIPEKLAVGHFVLIKNIEVTGEEIIKKMKDQISTADRVLSKADFLKRFSTVLNPNVPLTASDLNVLLVHLARDKQALSYSAQTIKFKAEHEALPDPITQEDEAIANMRDTLASINAHIPPLLVKIKDADDAAREAVASKNLVRAKAALQAKKIAETTLAQRTATVLQLEGVFNQLQQAADNVEIVAAMRAGADALKSLNEQVGGAEGVQDIVDSVNEQMTITEEISSIINGTDKALDDAEVEEELEALEKAEKEKREQEAAARTAAQLAELAEADRKRKEKERQQEAQRALERKKSASSVDEASEEMANLSFQKPNKEEEERRPIPA